MTATAGVPPSTDPSPNSSPPGPTGVPPAPFSRKSRTPLYIGAVVVVVVVILFLVLLLPSFLGSSSGSGGSSNALTYDQARPIAQSAVAGYQGGGWAIVLAAGYAVNQSYSLPINASSAAFSGTGCVFTPAPGVTGDFTLPAITGNLSSGAASGWVFLFRNGAGNLSLVAVTEGHGTVLGTVSGSSCTSIFGLISPVPSNVIDSTQAAKAVSGLSSAFRSAHPNATALFGVFGGVSFFGQSIGAEWSVSYSTCTPSTPSGTPGSEFNATVGAVNGTVLSYATSSVTCSGISSTGSSTTPIGTVLALGLLSTPSSGPPYLYGISVLSAGGGITWLDTIPEITGPAGGAIGTPWNLTVTDFSGSPIAIYNSTSASWSGTTSQAISSTDTIIVSSPVRLAGDSLVFQGTGTYSGTVSVVL